MNTLPARVTPEQVEQYSLPYLTTAKGGYVSQPPVLGLVNLIWSRLPTGGQWDGLPVSKAAQERQRRHEPGWQAVYNPWQPGSA